MKKFTSYAIVVVAVFFGLGMIKNGLVQSAVESMVSATTGLKTYIGNCNVGVFNTRVEMVDLRIMNPSEYLDQKMLHMSEIVVDYNLRDILAGNIHLEELTIHLDYLMIVRDKDGEININRLKPKSSKQSDKSNTPLLTIDKLSLRIDTVIFKDYSGGGKPVEHRFDVGINETHNNITNLNAVVALMVTKAIAKTTLQSILKLDLKQLVQNLELSGSELSRLGFKGLSKTASQMASQAKNLLTGLKETVGSIAQ